MTIVKIEEKEGIRVTAQPLVYGEKGDKFTREDFTPQEWDSLKFKREDFNADDIAMLKQPAIEAAENANTATENANNATQNANTATENANQAAANANTLAPRVTALEDLAMSSAWYGVQWDLTNSNPAMTRIGNMLLHQSLPVQSKMRRCLLNTDGTINYYLHASDSTKKEDGTPAQLDGSDGDVMVEIPEYYYRVDTVGDLVKFIMSERPLAGFEKSEKCFISAYQATVKRDVLQLASVANSTPNFRGGNNNAAWDNESRTLLGRPATAISRTNGRTYARNKGAGWEQLTYNAYKSLFWLYYVEYANRNSQASFISAPDNNGFKQGGLGAGVTDLNGSKWSSFNSQYPFVPCGHTNSLGNRTGVVGYTMPAEYDAAPFTTFVPSYRGIENPFGHIYHWVDGVNIRVQAEDAGGRSTVFIAHNQASFNDTSYAGHRDAGDQSRINGYIKSLLLGRFADILTRENSGAGTTTYWTDYAYNSNIPPAGTSLRGLLVGGLATNGATAGLACVHSYHAPSNTYANIGLRLCFNP